MNRRLFVTRSATAAAALVTARSFAQAPASTPAPTPTRPAEPVRGAQLAGDIVKEFVVAGHANAPRVKEMLAVNPTLINASWDWGNGDFEMALNGASHIGRRDVALVLLEAGARLDAPCAAMLGETEVIKTFLRLTPNAANSRGAHGFSLLYHAAYPGKVEIAEALSPHLTSRARDCNQALLPASMVGNIEYVAWLLKHGVDNPNTKNFQGKTSLDLATERRHERVVALLRDAGGLSSK
jgi:ankyrin repeat protein